MRKYIWHASWLVYADTKIPWWRAAGALDLDANCWHSSAPNRAAFFLVGEETIAFRDHARFVGRLGANDRHSRFMDPRVGGDLRLW